MTKRLARKTLVGWIATSLGGGEAPFSLQVTLTWSSEEDLKALMATVVGSQLLGDIKNYSVKPPVVMMQSEILSRLP